MVRFSNEGALMRRRQFITLMGAAVVPWPCAVQAQQQQKRRLAVIQGGLLPGDANGQREVAAFEQGLKELGWKPGYGNWFAHRLPFGG
jgi:hypothetical protein